MLPMVNPAPYSSRSVHAPSHSRSCGQTRPVISAAAVGLVGKLHRINIASFHQFDPLGIWLCSDRSIRRYCVPACEAAGRFTLIARRETVIPPQRWFYALQSPVYPVHARRRRLHTLDFAVFAVPLCCVSTVCRGALPGGTQPSRSQTGQRVR